MPSRKSDEDQIGDFMDQVEFTGKNLPTMEELAFPKGGNAGGSSSVSS